MAQHTVEKKIFVLNNFRYFQYLVIFCVVIISVFGFFWQISLFAVVKVSLLIGDSENSENITTAIISYSTVGLSFFNMTQHKSLLPWHNTKIHFHCTSQIPFTMGQQKHLSIIQHKSNLPWHNKSPFPLYNTNPFYYGTTKGSLYLGTT